jgi:hypothetical protein
MLHANAGRIGAFRRLLGIAWRTLRLHPCRLRREADRQRGLRCFASVRCWSSESHRCGDELAWRARNRVGASDWVGTRRSLIRFSRPFCDHLAQRRQSLAKYLHVCQAGRTAPADPAGSVSTSRSQSCQHAQSSAPYSDANAWPWQASISAGWQPALEMRARLLTRHNSCHNPNT